MLRVLLTHTHTHTQYPHKGREIIKYKTPMLIMAEIEIKEWRKVQTC